LGGGFSDADTVTPDADGIYSTPIGDDPGNLIPSRLRGRFGLAERERAART